MKQPLNDNIYIYNYLIIHDDGLWWVMIVTWGVTLWNILIVKLWHTKVGVPQWYDETTPAWWTVWISDSELRMFMFLLQLATTPTRFPSLTLLLILLTRACITCIVQSLRTSPAKMSGCVPMWPQSDRSWWGSPSSKVSTTKTSRSVRPGKALHTFSKDLNFRWCLCSLLLIVLCNTLHLLFLKIRFVISWPPLCFFTFRVDLPEVLGKWKLRARSHVLSTLWAPAYSSNGGKKSLTAV